MLNTRFTAIDLISLYVLGLNDRLGRSSRSKNR
jgi:hypothetical protein